MRRFSLVMLMSCGVLFVGVGQVARAESSIEKIQFGQLRANQAGENFSLVLQVKGLTKAPKDDEHSYDDEGGRGGENTEFDAIPNYPFIKVSPQAEFSVLSSRDGMQLMGAFKPETNYTVTVLKGFTLKTGDTLLADKTFKVKTGSFNPQFKFSNSGRYVPLKFQSQLQYEAVNYQNVHIKVSQIYPQNLHEFLVQNSDITYTAGNMSDVVLEKNIKLKKVLNKPVRGTLDISDLKPVGQGLYLVAAFAGKSTSKSSATVSEDGAGEGGDGAAGDSGTSNSGEGAGDNSQDKHPGRLLTSMVFAVSDLSAVAKVVPESKVVVWIQNVSNLEASTGAQVELISTTNRKMGNCETDAQGYCEIKTGPAETKGVPFAITFKHKGDLNYLRFQDLEISNDRYQAGKLAYPKQNGGLEAYVYQPRDLFRPGEKVDISVMVRNSHYEVVANNPIRIKVISPRGTIVSDSVNRSSAMGMVHLGLQTQATFDTGKYSIMANFGDQKIGEGSFLLEEFVPERIGIVAKAQKNFYTNKEPIKFDVAANYLFGPPVASGETKVKCISEVAFKKIPNAAEYSTGTYSDTEQKPQEFATLTFDLNDQGKASSACQMPHSTVSEMMRITAAIEVSEAGSGRASKKKVSAFLGAANEVIGMKINSVSDRKFSLEGKAFDVDGNALKTDGSLSAQLFKIRRVWYYSNAYYSYRVEQVVVPTPFKKEIHMERGHFSIDADFPQAWGEYVMRVTNPRTQMVSDLKVRAPGYWWDEEGDFSVAGAAGGQKAAPSPEDLKLVVSKLEMEAGDNFNLSFESPFAGKAIVTLEGESIYERKLIHVDKAGLVKVDLKAPNVLPNVYVTVMVIKKAAEEGGKFIPARAFGARSVQIVPKKHILTVKVDAVEKMESRKNLEVSLSNSQNEESEYTLALVDEGILQMTEFKTPQPEASFFQARRLDILTSDTLGWTLAYISKSPGGDAAGGGKKNNMPVRLVAFWKDSIKSDSRGRAKVTIPVPAFQGKLRIMAVASAKTAMGGSSSNTIVADPLVLQPTLPRLVMDGDKFRFPVSIVNTSGSNREVQVSIQSQGPVKVTVPTQKMSLADKQSKLLYFDAKVEGLGEAKIDVFATADKLKSEDHFTIPSYSASFEQTVVATTDATLPVELSKLLPTHLKNNGIDLTVAASSAPYVEKLAYMKHLIHYPYGCIEQTTSGTLPLVYMAPLLKWVDPKGEYSKEEITKMVDAGVDRVTSMQTFSGGFSYWPGGTEADPWGTAYATFMLLEAKKAGFNVSQSVIDAAIAYLQNEVGASHYKAAAYHCCGNEFTDPFMLYVLAKAGKNISAPLMRMVDAPIKTIGTGAVGENQFLLLAAAKLASNDEVLKRFVDQKSLMSISFDHDPGNDWYYWNHWAYWSSLRSDGIRLAIVEDLWPGSSEATLLASRLAQKMTKVPYYYSTQEIAWAVLGLGKRIAKAEKIDLSKATLTYNGKEVGSKTTSDNMATWHLSVADYKKATLKLQGLDAKQTKSVHLIVSARGYTDKWPENTQGIFFTRKYFNSAGMETSLGSVKVGDSLVVGLTLANYKHRPFENLAIVDRVPSGFEIENPRLTQTAQGDNEWMGEDSTRFKPKYVDIRDDRIQLFGDLNGEKPLGYYYQIRAVTPGEFIAPPAHVELMYEPEIAYYTGPEVAKIVPAEEKK